MNLLEKLDIFGIPNSSEDAILACLLQGEPGLLIGPPGTAKTELLDLIGSALREKDKKAHPGDRARWFTFQTYDTSKLNPEDLLGFPNPKAILEGHMEYVRLPSTVWDKDMVVWDEINRCEKSRQSNLFEIIRSRRINGIPTGNKFIFSAMNPLGDTGTTEMSEALTDRHVFYIWFSQFDTFIEEDKDRIIQRVGRNESVGMRHWGNKHYSLDSNDDGPVNETLAEVGKNIQDIMTSAASIYDRLHAELGKSVSRLVIRVASAIADEKNKKDSKIGNLDISGRRASMMLRALISLRAIQLAKAEILQTPLPTLESTLVNGCIMAIPIGISQKATADSMVRVKSLVQEVVKAQYAVLFSNNSDADRIYSIFYDKNPISRLNAMLSTSSISKLTEQKLWSDLYGMCKDTELEAMLGILNQAYKILPASIEISKESIQKEKNRKNFMIEAPYSNHKDFIEVIKNKMQGYPILEFAISRTFFYLSRIGKSHANSTVVTNLHEVDKLAATLKQKLVNLSSQNNNQNASSAQNTGSVNP